jgi:polygalacturonase
MSRKRFSGSALWGQNKFVIATEANPNSRHAAPERSTCAALIKESRIRRANPEAVFDVRTYGARGDGSSIDTAAINKAIGAANLQLEKVDQKRSRLDLPPVPHPAGTGAPATASQLRSRS